MVKVLLDHREHVTVVSARPSRLSHLQTNVWVRREGDGISQAVFLLFGLKRFET